MQTPLLIFASRSLGPIPLSRSRSGGVVSLLSPGKGRKDGAQGPLSSLTTTALRVPPADLGPRESRSSVVALVTVPLLVALDKPP